MIVIISILPFAYMTSKLGGDHTRVNVIGEVKLDLVQIVAKVTKLV
jgi:hypothetical protein